VPGNIFGENKPEELEKENPRKENGCCCGN